MSKEKSKKKVRVFSKMLCFIALLVLVAFLYMIYKLNVLPSKYFYAISITLGLLWFIYFIICINKRIKKSILLIINILAIIFIAGESYVTYELYQTYDFLNNGIHVKSTKDIYYVVVNKNSVYNNKSDIKNKTVYYYEDITEIDKLKEIVTKRLKVTLEEVEDYHNLFDGLLEDNEKIILINAGSYDALIENDEKYKDNLKKIDEIEFEKILENVTSESNIMKQPFIVYLSGIDTRTDSMPSRSLSDVNMFIVVNPDTRKILLVNIPRDYYVHLHGKSGLRDKLTHAGVLGGLELSKATVEDILGYKADYYARVNFNSVVKLVDAIGGITINSDVDYSFKCWTDKSCVFRPGANKVDGKCALAFARERHAYKTGDRHRGENQQQVIQLVVDKLTSSKNLIQNYDRILKALEGTFESNLSTDNITSVVQFQLSDMRGWEFITSNLNGTGSNEPTYSYPNSSLSVMFPDQKTVEEAKAKIKEVLEEKEED